MAKAKSQRSLDRWTRQKWRTPSGKKSSETGEVYAPEEKIKRLKSTASGRAKLARANKKKRAATRAGKQHARHGLHSKGKRRRTRKFVGGRVGFSDGGDDFAEKLRAAIISQKELKEKARENALVGEDGTIYPSQFMKQRSEAAYDRAKMTKYQGEKETVLDVKNRMNYGNIEGNNEKERYESLQQLIAEQGVKERKGDYVDMLHPYEVARLGYPYNIQDGMNAYRFYSIEELEQDKDLRELLKATTNKYAKGTAPDPRGKTAFERNVGNIR